MQSRRSRAVAITVLLTFVIGCSFAVGAMWAVLRMSPPHMAEMPAPPLIKIVPAGRTVIEPPANQVNEIARGAVAAHTVARLLTEGLAAGEVAGRPKYLTQAAAMMDSHLADNFSAWFKEAGRQQKAAGKEGAGGNTVPTPLDVLGGRVRLTQEVSASPSDPSTFTVLGFWKRPDGAETPVTVTVRVVHNTNFREGEGVAEPFQISGIEVKPVQ